MSIGNTSEPSWIEEELIGIDLGDERLNKRIFKVAKDLSEHPSLPINHACQDWAATKGAYRLFENDAIDAEKILEPHIENTRQRILNYKRVVIVQDTSLIDFTEHWQTSGLGSFGGGNHYHDTQGLLLHSCLALTEKGLPLGLTAQQIWARKPQKVKGFEHTKIPIEEKESFKWLKGLRESARLLPETEITMVCDREADIYEFFSEAIDQNIDLIVRLKNNRVAYDDYGDIKIMELLNMMDKQADIELVVPGTGSRQPRLANLEVRFSEVTLTSRPRGEVQKRLQHLKDMSMWVVEFKEVGAKKKGVVPLHWVLITTREVSSLKQAMQIGSTYRLRWEIELYFKALKSGCGVERCRLAAGHKLARYINVMSIVAWRILWMTWLNRTEEDAKADLVFSDAEWKSIWLRHYVKEIKRGLMKPEPPKQPISLKDAIRWMAMRGGFLGRKSDGDPGQTTIWRGWLELIGAAEMYEVLSGIKN